MKNNDSYFSEKKRLKELRVIEIYVFFMPDYPKGIHSREQVSL